MKVAVFSAKGEQKEEKTIKADIFDSAVNPVLIHEVVVAQMSNRRLATAKSKTRGEVAGGGKKPHKQKGTGRARSGSTRNPIWRGGGIVFGPTGIQNFIMNINKKKKRAALVSALATKKEEIVIIEELKTEKTKDFAKLIEKIAGQSKALMIFNGLVEKNILASRNIKNVKTIDYRNINVYDVLNADKLVFVGDSLEKTSEFLGARK